MQVLNNSIFDKNREISILQESVGSKKQGRKESRAKIFELEKEVVELLTLVQQGRDELAVKKGELLDIARLVDDYKRKEIRTSERHAGFLDQIDSRDKVIYEQEDTLVVSVLYILCLCFPLFSSTYLSTSLSIYLSIYLSTSLSIYLSISPFLSSISNSLSLLLFFSRLSFFSLQLFLLLPSLPLILPLIPPTPHTLSAACIAPRR